MIEITETDALSRVAAYCSTAEHCRAEVTEKLQRWGIPYDAIDRIINRLEQEKYIDEERFCRAFIHDKYRFAKWGKIKIGQALQLKKIPQSVFYRYLNEIDEDEYLAVLENSGQLTVFTRTDQQPPTAEQLGLGLEDDVTLPMVIINDGRSSTAI